MTSCKQRQRRNVQRYDLALRITAKDDIRKMPNTIDDITAKLNEDELLSDLIACGELRGNILHLRCCDPDRKTDVQQNISSLKKLFGVELELVEPKYLLLVERAQIYTEFKMTPQQIGKANSVKVLQLYRKSANWYLQLGSLDDALTLAKRGSVFLGQNTAPFKVRPVTGHYFECFKCSAAGHYQDQCTSETQICGKCSGAHETRHCSLMETRNFQCPNCDPEVGKGHASYFVQCKNPNTQALRAMMLAEPDWRKSARRATLMQKVLPSTVPKRGRPRKASVERRRMSGIMESDRWSATGSGKRKRAEDPDGRPAAQSSKRARIEEPVTNDNRNNIRRFLITRELTSLLDEDEASQRERV